MDLKKLRVCHDFEWCRGIVLSEVEKGEAVEARFAQEKGSKRWFTGTIKEERPSGYTIQYEDGEEEKNVRRQNICTRQDLRNYIRSLLKYTGCHDDIVLYTEILAIFELIFPISPGMRSPSSLVPLSGDKIKDIIDELNLFPDQSRLSSSHDHEPPGFRGLILHGKARGYGGSKGLRRKVEDWGGRRTNLFPMSTAGPDLGDSISGAQRGTRAAFVNHAAAGLESTGWNETQHDVRKRERERVGGPSDVQGNKVSLNGMQSTPKRLRVVGTKVCMYVCMRYHKLIHSLRVIGGGTIIPPALWQCFVPLVPLHTHTHTHAHTHTHTHTHRSVRVWRSSRGLASTPAPPPQRRRAAMEAWMAFVSRTRSTHFVHKRVLVARKGRGYSWGRGGTRMWGD